jgi:hypothetical protein
MLAFCPLWDASGRILIVSATHSIETTTRHKNKSGAPKEGNPNLEDSHFYPQVGSDWSCGNCMFPYLLGA